MWHALTILLSGIVGATEANGVRRVTADAAPGPGVTNVACPDDPIVDMPGTTTDLGKFLKQLEPLTSSS